MIKSLALFAALTVTSCTPALAEDRPIDTHVGDVYVNNRFAYTLGEFWDRADCEFVGKGVKDAATRLIFRPYDTTPEQALELMTVEVKCWKKRP